MHRQPEKPAPEHPGPGQAPMTKGDPLYPLFCNMKSQPLKEQQLLISVMVGWFGFEGRERAFFIKLICPELSDADVARWAGVCRTSVFRWREYQCLKDHLDARGSDRRRASRRGFKTKDHRIEAFYEVDDGDEDFG